MKTKTAHTKTRLYQSVQVKFGAHAIATRGFGVPLRLFEIKDDIVIKKTNKRIRDNINRDVKECDQPYKRDTTDY